MKYTSQNKLFSTLTLIVPTEILSTVLPNDTENLNVYLYSKLNLKHHY